MMRKMRISAATARGDNRSRGGAARSGSGGVEGVANFENLDRLLAVVQQEVVPAEQLPQAAVQLRELLPDLQPDLPVVGQVDHHRDTAGPDSTKFRSHAPILHGRRPPGRPLRHPGEGYIPPIPTAEWMSA